MMIRSVRGDVMALFWIGHEKDGKRRILIQEGSTLIFARLDATMAGFEGDFIEAHRLDAAMAGFEGDFIEAHRLDDSAPRRCRRR